MTEYNVTTEFLEGFAYRNTDAGPMLYHSKCMRDVGPADGENYVDDGIDLEQQVRWAATHECPKGGVSEKTYWVSFTRTERYVMPLKLDRETEPEFFHEGSGVVRHDAVAEYIGEMDDTDPWWENTEGIDVTRIDLDAADED